MSWLMDAFSDRDTRSKFPDWTAVFTSPFLVEREGNVFALASTEKIAELLSARLSEVLSPGHELPVYVELGAGASSSAAQAFLEWASKRPDSAFVSTSLLLIDKAYGQELPLAEFLMLIDLVKKTIEARSAQEESSLDQKALFAIEIVMKGLNEAVKKATNAKKEDIKPFLDLEVVTRVQELVPAPHFGYDQLPSFSVQAKLE